MPFFFDLSSLLPLVERNPFAPVDVHDEAPEDIGPEEIPAEELIDTGLPIPAQYNIDFMRAMVQDPFHLFVHWQLRDNPYDRLERIFPGDGASTFHTVLKLVDETNQISVYFEAAYAREYWFSVFPDRTYRVELGLRSPRYGYIKLLTSQSVRMPRGAPSDQMAEEPQYQVTADDYLQVLRDSNIVPARVLDPEAWAPGAAGVEAQSEKQAAIEEMLPETFRRILKIIADIQTGRDYDRLWERLSQEELAGIVRDFILTMSRLGQGEAGYLLLLRYLPELLRRVLATEGEIQIDEPVSIYFAKQIGLASSEFSAPEGPGRPGGGAGGLGNIGGPGRGQAGGPSSRPWLPSAKR